MKGRYKNKRSTNVVSMPEEEILSKLGVDLTPGNSKIGVTKKNKTKSKLYIQMQKKSRRINRRKK